MAPVFILLYLSLFLCIGLYYIAGEGKPGRLLRYDDQDPEFQRLNKALWHLKELNVNDISNSKSLNDHLKPQGFDANMIRLAHAGYANTLCTTSDDLSLKRAVKWSQLWDEEGEEEGDYALNNSWSTLLAYLKKNLQIETGTPVSNIEYLPKSSAGDFPFSDLVKVTANNGCTYYAKSVVVTSSPKVLKSDLIKFSPPLNNEFQEAIDSVNMHNIVKVFLKFSKPVWPKNLSGMIISDEKYLLPEIWFNDVSDMVDDDEPAKAYAVAFTTAAYAKNLMSLPRHEVQRLCITQLDEMFSLLEPQHMAADPSDPATQKPTDLPKASESLLGVMYWVGFSFFLIVLERISNMYIMQDWNADHHPYIGGGYCSPKVNTNTDAIDRLRLPYGNGNIFFAGEATNLPGATAHAALESGVRAAGQVAKVLSK